MKTIVLRLLLFLLFAMVLGFISRVEFKVEEGKVHVVGRCQTSFVGLTPELVASENSEVVVNNNQIAVAQLELQSYNGDKPVFSVIQIFTTQTDQNGYFILKNLSNNYTYVLLGIQHNKNTSVPVQLLAMANAREKQGKIISLGCHNITFKADSQSGEKMVTANVKTSVSNQQFVDYFIAQSPLKTFARQIKNNDYWGKSNAISVINADRVIFTGLGNAAWQELNTNNS